MLPWDKIITVQKRSALAVYLQISNAFISVIKEGILKPGSKLPASRALADALGLHRKTVLAAYNELLAQGWIYSGSTSGTFVSKHLPEVAPRKLVVGEQKNINTTTTGYYFKPITHLHPASMARREVLGFHEGPDVRLIPVAQIAKAYKSVMMRKSLVYNLNYVDGAGNKDLKNVLSEHLNTSRGLRTTEENIFISRGSQMAIYMLAHLLLSKGDNVIVGELSYYYADHAFIHEGANLVRVAVNNDGLDVDEIEQVCKKKKIRAIYVTSHHHYPTTVTLSASRRMRLLALAEKYGFIIIEDDYDYDIHYETSPILPLASADKHGMVIYIGTLSKTVAPALRIGYIAGPVNLILEINRLRQILDIQGDSTLEKAVAELFELGEIRRHMKKALKEYHNRRNFMSDMLKQKLGNAIDFKVPDGGLSIWAKFDKRLPLPDVAERLRKKGIVISRQTKRYSNHENISFGHLPSSGTIADYCERSGAD